MREHQKGEAGEVDEERKSQRQIALVHEKKISERERLAGAGRHIDTDVHEIQCVRRIASGQTDSAVGTLLLYLLPRPPGEDAPPARVRALAFSTMRAPSPARDTSVAARPLPRGEVKKDPGFFAEPVLSEVEGL